MTSNIHGSTARSGLLLTAGLIAGTFGLSTSAEAVGGSRGPRPQAQRQAAPPPVRQTQRPKQNFWDTFNKPQAQRPAPSSGRSPRNATPGRAPWAGTPADAARAAQKRAEQRAFERETERYRQRSESFKLQEERRKWDNQRAKEDYDRQRQFYEGQLERQRRDRGLGIDPGRAPLAPSRPFYR
jgi:hypothetical protein